VNIVFAVRGRLMLEAIEQVDLPALVPGLFWPDDEWTAPTLRQYLGQPVEAVAYGEFWHNGEPDAPTNGPSSALSNDQGSWGRC
jgi:hypothetical protein